MPTIVRVAGFRIDIIPGDHVPPHVHVLRAGQQAKLDIASARVINAGRMPDLDLAKAKRLVADHCELLMQAWRKINGDP